MSTRKIRKRPYRGPADVSRVDWNRDLTQPQLRILLEFMGYMPPDGKQPKIDLVQELVEINKEKLQRGFDVIVRGKEPTQEQSKPDIPAATNLTGEAVQRIMDQTKKELEDKAYRIVSVVTGEETEAALRAKVDELTKHVGDLAKKELQKAAADYKPIVIKNGKKTKKVEGVMPEEFERMIQLGSMRVNILLVGPAGCGKTYLAEKLKEALDLPNYGDASMSEGATEADFTGRLLPIGKDGAFEHVSTPFLKCYEEGGVFLFDELDNGDPNLIVFLNKALANESITVPARHKNPIVKKHPDFVAIGAANTFGHGADAMYVGRNQLDAATLDRFRVGLINMDYSEKVERALVRDDVYAWAIKVRKSIRKHGFRKIMSTRTMLDMTKMAQGCDWKEKQWNEAYFADWDKNEHHIVMQELGPDLSEFVREDGGNRA